MLVLAGGAPPPSSAADRGAFLPPRPAALRLVGAFDHSPQLGAQREGVPGMPAGKIKRYDRVARQAIDAHDELARQSGELVELSFAGIRPRGNSLYRGSFHRNATSGLS
jgi:hypothetical protein